MTVRTKGVFCDFEKLNNGSGKRKVLKRGQGGAAGRPRSTAQVLADARPADRGAEPGAGSRARGEERCPCARSPGPSRQPPVKPALQSSLPAVLI